MCLSQQKCYFREGSGFSRTSAKLATKKKYTASNQTFQLSRRSVFVFAAVWTTWQTCFIQLAEVKINSSFPLALIKWCFMTKTKLAYPNVLRQQTPQLNNQNSKQIKAAPSCVTNHSLGAVFSQSRTCRLLLRQLSPLLHKLL